MNNQLFKSIGFGAYDGYQSLDEIGETPITSIVPASDYQMHGWVQNKAEELGISAWEYFKPMIPWFILSTLVTAYVTWKVASVFCSGRLLYSQAKHSVKSGLKSAKSALGSAKGSAKAGLGKAKAAIGFKQQL